MSALTDLRRVLATTPGTSTLVFGGQSHPCALRHGGVVLGEEGAAQMGVGTLTLLYVFPDIPSLESGSAVTVGGTPYVLSQNPRRSADGLLGTVTLENAS